MSLGNEKKIGFGSHNNNISCSFLKKIIGVIQVSKVILRFERFFFFEAEMYTFAWIFPQTFC